MESKLLIEGKITSYLEKLASGEAAPGGGAAAALAGAEGAALLSMVSNFTIGKKKFEEFEAHNVSMREKALEVMKQLSFGIDRDKEAFFGVATAYCLPKESEEDRKVRKEAISEASIIAAEVPLDVIEQAVNGLEIAMALIGKSNPNLLDDVYTGAILLKACIEGSKGNIETNLPYITDEELAKEMEIKCKKLTEKAEFMYKEIIKIR